MIARSEKEAQELRKAQGATTFLVGVIDDMNALIKKEGGIAQAMKSSEYQRIQSMSGSLTAALKEAMELGTLDNGVERLVKQITGGGDVTGWRSFLGDDATAGLSEIRRNQLARFNTKIKAQDENAGVFKIDPPTAAAQSPMEADLQRILEMDKGSQPSAVGAIASLAGGGGVGMVEGKMRDAALQANLAHLDNLVAMGNFELLEQVVKKGTPELSKAALERLQGMKNPNPGASFTVAGR